MYSLTVLAATAVACLIAGLLLGILIGQRSSKDSQRYREVERKLDQVMQEKKAYEDQVVEHFGDTARLLNTLTESYKNVHSHLANGASTLCQDTGPIALSSLNAPADNSEIPAQLADIQAPLDYAPKTSPDETGMLNEEFGLERKPAPAPVDEPQRH